MTGLDAINFLMDLSGRIRRVPVQYGIDEADCDQLKELAEQLSLRCCQNDPPELNLRVLVWTSARRWAVAYRTDFNGGGWVSYDGSASSSPLVWMRLLDGPGDISMLQQNDNGDTDS